MITKILDRHHGNNALVIMDDEDSENLQMYYEENSDFDDSKFVFLNDYDCKILIGLLSNYLENKSKTK